MIFRLSGSIKNLFAPSRREAGTPVLRGNMHRAIVIEDPDDVFQTAVFIVRDGFMSGEGVGRREILEQARQAAAAYCPGRKAGAPGLGSLALFLLGTAAGILLILALSPF